MEPCASNAVNSSPPNSVVPQLEVQLFLARIHEDCADVGQVKMDTTIMCRFCWPLLRKDVTLFCNNGPTYLSKKTIPPIQPRTIETNCCWILKYVRFVDVVGQLLSTVQGNRYFLVMVDHFTRWVETVPLSSADGHFYSTSDLERLGCPLESTRTSFSDRGRTSRITSSNSCVFSRIQGRHTRRFTLR